MALLLSTGVHAALFAGLQLPGHDLARPAIPSERVLLVEVVREGASDPGGKGEPTTHPHDVPPAIMAPRLREIRSPEPIRVAPPSIAAPADAVPASLGAGESPRVSLEAGGGVSPPGAPIVAHVRAPEAVLSSPPRYLSTPQPDYPPDALELGQEGSVVLRVRVSADGRPSEVVLARSSGIRSLDVSAIRGVRRWIFVAAREDGKDVEAWMEIPVRFVLR